MSLQYEKNPLSIFLVRGPRLLYGTGYGIEDFRKQVRIWIMIIRVRIIYRILYEFSTDTGEVAKSSGLYCSTSTTVDFYPVQVVKH